MNQCKTKSSLGRSLLRHKRLLGKHTYLVYFNSDIMSSKAAALATLTNHGGKRKADGAAADGDDAATAKKKFKLKSHNRVSYVSIGACEM